MLLMKSVSKHCCENIRLLSYSYKVQVDHSSETPSIPLQWLVTQTQGKVWLRKFNSEPLTTHIFIPCLRHWLDGKVVIVLDLAITRCRVFGYHPMNAQFSSCQRREAKKKSQLWATKCQRVKLWQNENCFRIFVKFCF